MSRWDAVSDYDYSESMGDPVPRQERSQPRPQSGQKFEKPEPRKKSKARADRLDEKRLKAFRDQVWKLRREAAGGAITPESEWTFCAGCGRLVRRGKSVPIQTGEVHHKIGRRAKATRYDPDNGELLCNVFVNDCHGKAQRREV